MKNRRRISNIQQGISNVQVEQPGRQKTGKDRLLVKTLEVECFKTVFNGGLCYVTTVIS